MKLSMKQILIFSGVLALTLLNCQSKEPAENRTDINRATETIAAEENFKTETVELRLAEIEQQLAQRTAELQEVEEKIRELETELSTLEIKLAEQNRTFSREIVSLKRMNYLFWFAILILLVILVIAGFWLWRKTRWPRKETDIPPSPPEATAEKNEPASDSQIIHKD